jgi:hypothetical protein
VEVKINPGALLVLFLAMTTGFQPVSAQGDTGLVLRLSRDFGFSSGTGKIQGLFTMKASGPANLRRVVFLLDSNVIGEVSQPPFNLKFNTDSFELGVHRLAARGFLDDGQELQSNEIIVEFVSAQEGWKAGMRFALPILGMIFGVMALSLLAILLTNDQRKNLPLGTPRNYGFAGGTICPKCQRPFPMHFLSLNLGWRSKLERCPFCGKWSVVSSLPLSKLREAERNEIAGGKQPVQDIHRSEDEELLRELDESRYQDL